MPAERINVSFEPRPLEVLYSKYCPDKVINTTTSSSTFIKPSSSSIAQPLGQVRKSRHDAPPRLPVRRQELGDLKKLGRELTKMERVQMLFDMSGNVCKAKARSCSQPSSAGVSLKCLNTKCQQCSMEHKRDEGQQTRLRNLKSKLRLVAARSLPDCQQTQHSTSPLRHSSQRVVPLPLLQVNYQRNASSSEDFATLRDVRQSLRHMLFPKPVISRRAAAVWNYRFSSGGQPAHSRELHREHRGEYADSSDASSQALLVPPTGPPVCSLLDDHYDGNTISTFDADRIDSEQLEYVLERFSVTSTESASTTLSHESDTATFSARAQRPSTTDTVATPQRLVETRASMAPPISPISPRQRTRGGGESWPPQFTVVPSWPSLDDPYRFQYFGCGVHRDIMRRLHKSRGKRRNGKRGGGGSDSEQQQPPPQPQKLKVVVPSHTQCALCQQYECEHNTPFPTHTAPQSQAPSVAGKSTKSRDSLSISVCTVQSGPNKPPKHNSSVTSGKFPLPNGMEKGGMSNHRDKGSNSADTVSVGKGVYVDGEQADTVSHVTGVAK